MGILCGVDIVEINRIKRAFDNPGTAFRDRVFTINEIDYCESKKAVKFQSYAARFAAKEAVAKAFGTGLGSSMGLKDVEVLNNESGKPYIVLSGGAKELYDKMKAANMDISLSHCDNYAVAYVIIQT
ncbi:MAG TPA: holo-ACP synthase [Clostridia bacterium]|nr:holo-ACP synthase [Clostridia bacterium]